MRTPIGFGLIAVALVALPVPVAGATPVPAAPTNVTVAWEATAVRITWQETGANPDRVCQEATATCSDIAADQPDSVLVPASFFSPSTSTRVSVQITGTTPSGFGYSPAFDTQRLTAPTVTTIEPWVDGRLRLAWTASALPTDTTPSDPLDLPPPSPAQYRLLAFDGEVGIPFGPVVTTTSTVITAATGGLFAVAAVNEWTWTTPPQPVDYLNIWSSVVHATIPTTASYGGDTVVTGTVLADPYYCYGMPPGCSPSPDGPGTPVRTPSAGRTVVLQARNASTDPWYTVTSATSDANGKFRIAVTAPGTRDYRVIVVGVHKPPSSVARSAAVSSSVHTVTYNRVVSARFDDPYVNAGDPVTARLTMAVRSSVRSTLQRWNGSAWVDVKWVYLTDGTGSYTFTATPGVVGWRFVIPATTSPAGLPVAGTSSGPFYFKAV